MVATQIFPPYPIFTDNNGSPLDGGYIYIGEANQNPETNSVPVFWDSAFTVPAAMPIRTVNGYPSNNGVPAIPYVNGGYSMTVRNSRRELVIYSPFNYGFDPNVTWKTPYDYAAVPGQEMTADNSAAVQALFDAWSASFNATAQAFTIVPYFGGKTFRCDSEIFLNETRSPGGLILGGGGGIYSRNTNGVALNALNTNVLTIRDFQIYGDRGSFTPDVGLFYGVVAGGAIAPGVRLVNFITRGNFNKAAGINLASEVGGHFGCYFNNQSPVRTAQTFFWAQSTESIDHWLTGGSASIQASLDVAGNSIASTTRTSFLGHPCVGCDYKRPSPFSTVIVSITKANPAVVTVGAGQVAAGGWVNGTEISLHNVLGMTELREGIYTIANISGDSFELSGVDSTGYGTFTSGRAWQASGPAFTLAGPKQMTMTSCYSLGYTEVNHIIDLKHANAIANVNLELQTEANTDYMCEILLPDSPSTAIIQGGFVWRNLSGNQRAKEAVFKVSGTGRVRIDKGRISLASLTQPYPTSGLFDDPSKVTLYDFEIDMPVQEVLNDAADFDVYDVVETAFNRNPRMNDYRGKIDYSQPTFRVQGGIQTAATFESIDTSASTADSVPPLLDLYRNNEGALANAALGGVRFTANNDATKTVLTVSSITQANPAVVTVDSAELIAAGWANGYVVLFGSLGGGMDGLQERGYTIANINTGAGTFELAGVDSTGFTAFVSGTVANAVKRTLAGLAGFLEDDTAYAENGRLLFQAADGGDLTTVGYVNRRGMFVLGNRVHTNFSENQTNLRNRASAINTVEKYAGKQVWDATNLKPVYARGSLDNNAWVNADGTFAHMPI